MRLFRDVRGLAALCRAVGCAVLIGFAHDVAGADTPDERGAWDVWKRQLDTPDDHAAVVKACAEFEQRAPGPIRICFPELPDNTSAAPREVPDF